MSSPSLGLFQHRSVRRLGGYLTLARISNVPTVFSNVLAGAALAGVLELNGEIALLTVAMIFFYAAGMFLNDLCDYDTDLRERPERPLPSGTVSRLEATAAVLALFGVGSALLWYVSATSFFSGMVLISVIVAYDAWHKTNPLSPLIMAVARALVYVTAFLAFSSELSWSLAVLGSLLALYVIGLTSIAKSESGSRLARHWPAAVLFLPVFYFAFYAWSAAMLPLLLLFAGWVVYSISFAYRIKGRSIGAAVGRLISGIALYDGLVLVAAGATSGAMLALAAFGITLLLQRYIRGT